MKKTTIIICLIISSIQCKKSRPGNDNPYGLPNATSNGAMSFACLVNGNPYICKSSAYNIGGGATIDSIYGFGNQDKGFYFYLIYFKIKAMASLNTWIQLDEDNNYFEIAGRTDCNGYYLEPYRMKGKGRINFSKIDTVNKILSGLFECTIPFPGCDTIKITEGRFDFKYLN